MTFNNLTFSKPQVDCGFTLASKSVSEVEKGAFMIIDTESESVDFDRLYLSSMSLDFKTVDAVVERFFALPTKLIVRTGSDLHEIGAFQARFKLTPVQLLHKLGLLDGCAIAGGAYLDKDDLDLMAQCGASLILTPSADMGQGLGIPEPKLILSGKVKAGFGTLDNRFNLRGDVAFEGELMRLTSSALMHKENILSEEQLRTLLTNKIFESKF